MILRRLGNKKKLMPLLLPHFPEHKTWIEPFFGSGSAFFYKPKAKYNILNDLDSDVFNLFQVVMNDKEALEKAFYLMPIHTDLLKYWKKHKETDPIKKALRFLFLSNFTFMGTGTQMRIRADNVKKDFYTNLDFTFDYISDVNFSNLCFRVFLKSIEIKDKESTFCYLDPPYLGTTDNYSHSFKEQDCIDLLDCVQKIGVKFAYSEFDNPFILQQAKERNLNVIILGERCNLKNRRTEILITNYENTQLKLF
jgi:DNA adenine methylase